MNDYDDITDRLQALGDNPVPPPTATQHLTAIAEMSARPSFSHKLRVGAAFAAGILLGGTGLSFAAANDALPEAANNAVVEAGAVVGLDLASEKSKGRSAAKAANADARGENGGGPAEVNTADCALWTGDGTPRNHGEYVSSVAKADYDSDQEREDAVTEAAESDCGKPVNAGEGDDTDADVDGKAKGADKRAENQPDTTGADAAENGATGTDVADDAQDGAPPAIADESSDDAAGEGDDEGEGEKPEDVPPANPGDEFNPNS